MDQGIDYGRRRHFENFYCLAPYPLGEGLKVAVIGNCQAEATRLLLASTGETSSFRIPPIFEWTADDLPYVRRAVEWADVVIAQPVRDNYRGLWGTRQISPDAVLYPVMRYDGLMPYHAIIRHPNVGDPPLFPYHDLRLIAEIAGLKRTAKPDYLSAHAMSVEQMARREREHGIVPMSDVLDAKPAWHLINHPDNATLATLAERLGRRLGLTTTPQPPQDREMLGGRDAAIEPEVAEVLGRLEAAREGTRILGDAAIEGAHRAFYAAHPEVVSAGLARHAERFRALGWQL